MKVSTRRFYYGWRVAAAASGIEFANAATAISILTVFVNPMSLEFGWSRTEVAGATSLGAVLGAALAPFSGRLVDRFGARMILVSGGLVVALGCLYLSMAQALLGFYAAFTMVRIADQGLVKIGASVSAGKWFFRYRGRAMGMVHFGGSAGVIVMAPMVQLAITYWDWRAAWVMLAGVMLCVGVIPCALIVRRQPEDLGLEIDGVPGRTASDNRVELQRDAQSLSLGQVVRTPAFWFVLASLFLTSTATSGIGLHLVPHLIQQGLSPASAVGAVSIMSMSGAVAALLAGASAEKAPAKLLMVVLYLLGAASMWVLSQADTLPETYMFAILQGMVGSGINTVAPIMWASYYGRRTLGSIFGLSRAAQVVGFAVGPLASAIVFDRTGTYQGAFLSLALVAIAAAIVLAVSRRPALRDESQEDRP